MALAAAGVLFLAWQLRHPPWIALTLALSFGFYGLVRKLAPFDSVRGLAVESGVMFFPAVAYLLWCELAGQGTFGHGHWRDDLLLVAGGPITAVPLVLFAFGAQRVIDDRAGRDCSTSRPSVALLLGIWVFHEPFGGARQVAFGCIWVALAMFTCDALRRYRGAGAAGCAGQVLAAAHFDQAAGCALELPAQALARDTAAPGSAAAEITSRTRWSYSSSISAMKRRAASSLLPSNTRHIRQEHGVQPLRDGDVVGGGAGPFAQRREVEPGHAAGWRARRDGTVLDHACRGDCVDAAAPASCAEQLAHARRRVRVLRRARYVAVACSWRSR